MKLSQSGFYVVDDTGHIVPAADIMAEVERLREELKHKDPARYSSMVNWLIAQRIKELEAERRAAFDAGRREEAALSMPRKPGRKE